MCEKREISNVNARITLNYRVKPQCQEGNRVWWSGYEEETKWSVWGRQGGWDLWDKRLERFMEFCGKIASSFS